MDFMLVGTGLGALSLVVKTMLQWWESTLSGPVPEATPWAVRAARRGRARLLSVAIRMAIIAGVTLLGTVALLLLIGASDRTGLLVIGFEIAGLVLGFGYWVFLIKFPAWRPHRPRPTSPQRTRRERFR